MTLQVTLDDFTFATGSATSSVLDGNVVDPFEELTLYADSAIIGTMNLEVNYTGSYPEAGWAVLVQKNGSSATVAAGSASFLDTPGAAGYRLSGSLQDGTGNVHVMGSYDAQVKQLPR